eukprot:TRINITY_DN12075_c0_g1_i10.p3 TRINITY_DN12075_c0_g1~~TRINITY_DN12075_c0_g1_i10.p3  ORF type:complete len:242 (+),score=-40.96 TRINITY_DN12075_c0_g1_i10:511-1236(+)
MMYIYNYTIECKHLKNTYQKMLYIPQTTYARRIPNRSRLQFSFSNYVPNKYIKNNHPNNIKYQIKSALNRLLQQHMYALQKICCIYHLQNSYEQRDPLQMNFLLCLLGSTIVQYYVIQYIYVYQVNTSQTFHSVPTNKESHSHQIFYIFCLGNNKQTKNHGKPKNRIVLYILLHISTYAMRITYNIYNIYQKHPIAYQRTTSFTRNRFSTTFILFNRQTTKIQPNNRMVLFISQHIPTYTM